MKPADHDRGLASRPNTGKPYIERIADALTELEASVVFDVVEDEDTGFIHVKYKNNILVTLSDNMSAMENWLLIKPVWRLLDILDEE